MMNPSLPLPVRRLGLAGLLPQAACLASMFASPEARFTALAAGCFYPALILSFLGGIHWGLAIVSRSNANDPALRTRLVVSVIPSLAAWVALLFPETTGLLMLAAAIAAMLWVDLRATRLGHAPQWYPKLRIPLTCVVVAALLLGASA